MAQQTVDRENLLERFALPEKYAGYGLCDPEGKEIGKVKEIFVNEEHESRCTSGSGSACSGWGPS